MIASYVGTTYRRRRLRRDLVDLAPWIRGRRLDVGATLDDTHPKVVLDAFPRAATTIRGDIQDIPFADDTFDTILAIEVLEHIPEPLEALRECARVLRPNGHLILTVPFMWPVHEDWRAPYYDYTRWTDRQWRAMCATVGLNPQIVRPQGGLLAVLCEGAKALVRRWPRPWRYAGYTAFPLVDALYRLDRPCRPVAPAGEIFTNGWCIVAAKPSSFRRIAA